MLALVLFVLAQSAEQSGAASAQSTAPIPDFTGVWMHPLKLPTTFDPSDPKGLGPGLRLPMTPWAEAKFKAAKPSHGGPGVTLLETNDPVFKCFPPGVPRIYLEFLPMEIIQIPGRVIMLFEYDHFVRQIYTDGRDHPKDLSPTWMGDSIGRWEGDTLIVDTIGFNDKTWLDKVGHPHSDALHLVERIRRVDHDTLVDDLTIDDPKAYTKPWMGRTTRTLRPGWNIMEYICEDNGQFVDFERMKGEKPSKSPAR
jgi:hypothetical protein